MVFQNFFVQFILINVAVNASLGFSLAKFESSHDNLLLRDVSPETNSPIMRKIKELKKKQFEALHRKTEGLGLKKSMDSSYKFLKKLAGISPFISQAAAFFEPPIDEKLIIAILWEEEDYRDFVDDTQDTWANLTLRNQQASVGSLSWSVGTNPWSISFGKAQMQPNTLAFLIDKGFLPEEIVENLENHFLGSKYNPKSLKQHLMILESMVYAPILVASYSFNRYQKWLKAAGRDKLNQKVLATLYYLYDKDPHDNPKPSIAGSCTIDRVNALLNGEWTGNMDHDLCAKRVR